MPFHAWQWKTDGKLEVSLTLKISLLKQKRRKSLNTRLLKEIILYAWYHPNGEQPHYELGYDEIVDPDWGDEFQKFEYVDCHIQDMAENAVDAAHLSTFMGLLLIQNLKLVTKIKNVSLCRQLIWKHQRNC